MENLMELNSMKKKSRVVIFCMSLIAVGCNDTVNVVAANDTDQTLVDTEQGKVHGMMDGDVVVFKGIPFAKPPVGDLRWKSPVAPEKRSYALDTQTYSKFCTQSEDCLYLNIFRPAEALVGKNKPVLVFIHGGAFGGGDASYFDGKALADENGVVVVTINYRLGALGFLAHPALLSDTEQVSGNYGIMDQQAALSWVKANIHNFGGDSSNVTVMGQSAGGVSVSVLLASPLSKGLFDKAVIASGAYLRDQPTLADANISGDTTATKLGCTGTSELTAECLRALTMEQVATMTGPNAGLWAPVVDGYVLKESTYKAFQSGDFNQVPVMTGAAQNESNRLAYYYSEASIPTADTYAAKASTLVADSAVTPEEIAAYYPITDYDFPQPFRALLSTIADYRFVCGMNSDINNISKFVSKTWRYEFAESDVAQTGPDSGTITPLSWFGDFGDYHSSDLAYWFGQFVTAEQTEKNLTLSKNMRSYLTNFMMSGNPNGVGLPVWTAVGEGSSVKFATPVENDIDVSARHQCSLWENKAPSQKLMW
jgi:Carboxylesterase type B